MKIELVDLETPLNSEDTESDNTEGADSSEEDNDPEGAVNPE